LVDLAICTLDFSRRKISHGGDATTGTPNTTRQVLFRDRVLFHCGRGEYRANKRPGSFEALPGDQPRPAATIAGEV
jgi:hypothetical protein